GPLSVSAQLPVTYSQQGDLSNLPPSSRGPSSLLGGFGDLRLTPRLALLRQEWAGIDLATQVTFEFPTARSGTLTDDGRVRAEGRVGTTVCPVRGLAIDLAGGGALTDGVGAPRARFLFGIGWSPAACNENPSSYRPLIRPSPLPVQVFSEALSCPPVPTEPK